MQRTGSPGVVLNREVMFRARLFNGVSFLLIITTVAYFGGIWFITPTIAILPFSVSLYRKLNDWNVATWFRLVPVSACFV